MKDDQILYKIRTSNKNMCPYTLIHSISIGIFMKSLIFLKRDLLRYSNFFIPFGESYYSQLKFSGLRRPFSIIFLGGYLKSYNSFTIYIFK
jgi:hypothetical protein